MFRPWLKVARPDDWTGMAVGIGAALVTLVLLLAAVMGTLPRGWVQAAGGHVWIVRAILVVVALWGTAWMRAIAVALLPRAPVLLRKRLTLPLRGRRVVVAVGSIAAIHVERRVDPVHEVFVVEMRDGAEYDLCPVHWEGAARLYSALRKRIA